MLSSDTSNIPLSAGEIDNLKKKLSFYEYEVVTKMEKTIMAIRSDKSIPDLIDDLEKMYHQIDIRDTLDLTHVCLIGNDEAIPIKPSIITSLMNKRNEEDNSLISELRTNLEREFSTSTFEDERDSYKTRRFAVRVPLEYVNAEPSHLHNIFSQLTGPINADIIYIIGDHNFIRLPKHTADEYMKGAHEPVKPDITPAPVSPAIAELDRQISETQEPASMPPPEEPLSKLAEEYVPEPEPTAKPKSEFYSKDEFDFKAEMEAFLEERRDRQSGGLLAPKFGVEKDAIIEIKSEEKESELPRQEPDLTRVEEKPLPPIEELEKEAGPPELEEKPLPPIEELEKEAGPPETELTVSERIKQLEDRLKEKEPSEEGVTPELLVPEEDEEKISDESDKEPELKQEPPQVSFEPELPRPELKALPTKPKIKIPKKMAVKKPVVTPPSTSEIEKEEDKEEDSGSTDFQIDLPEEKETIEEPEITEQDLKTMLPEPEIKSITPPEVKIEDEPVVPIRKTDTEPPLERIASALKRSNFDIVFDAEIEGVDIIAKTEQGKYNRIFIKYVEEATLDTVTELEKIVDFYHTDAGLVIGREVPELIKEFSLPEKLMIYSIEEFIEEAESGTLLAS